MVEGVEFSAFLNQSGETIQSTKEHRREKEVKTINPLYQFESWDEQEDEHEFEIKKKKKNRMNVINVFQGIPSSSSYGDEFFPDCGSDESFDELSLVSPPKARTSRFEITSPEKVCPFASEI
jgi:hypothetical protein